MSARESDALLAHAGVAAADLDALLHLIAHTTVVELDVTVGSTRLSLRRAPSSSPMPALASEIASDQSLAITSPLVGVFRAAVTVGQSLESGESIGVIEALGLPTSVDVPHGGTVESLLVADGQPVEYGQPLLVLRRAT